MKHLQTLVTTRLAASESRMRRNYWGSVILVISSIAVAWIGAILENWLAAVAGVLFAAIGLVMHLQVEMYLVAQRLVNNGDGAEARPQARNPD